MLFRSTNSFDHNFYTGDAVYYTPEKIITTSTDSAGNTYTQETINSFLFSEGVYYAKRIDANNIKLSKSLSDLYNGKFVVLDTTTTVNNNIIQLYKFNGKSLKPQNLLREVAPPETTGKVYETLPGFTGLLINGTEVLNYKSPDKIYYGPIENISVLAPGED